MTPELNEAIADLYSVFGHYRVSREEDYCTHCVSHEEAALIRSRRLQDLSAEDLRRYAMKALSTWGELEEFKHFLPRLLELAVAGDISFPTSLTSKVGERWRTWPDEEQGALHRFIDAWWTAVTHHHPSPVSLDEMIETLGWMELDLDTYLTRLGKVRTTDSARHIADLLSYPADELQRWLGGPDVGATLKDASATSPELATELLTALEAHEFWRGYHARSETQ